MSLVSSWFRKHSVLASQLKYLSCFVVLIVLAKPASGQTVVDVRTSLGNFSIELFDTAAPATVANFLSYVSSGRYNGTIIHRVIPNFIVQGGNWVFDEAQQAVAPIATDPPVVNEFNQSNTRGTLAMAKLPTDPNSATSSWFINLADNGANLDSQNGGFTVFGRVLGNGMDIVDGILNLPRIGFQNEANVLPLINFTSGAFIPANFVTIEMSVATPPASFQNSFVPETGIMSLRVALSDGALIELRFGLVSSSPNFVFQVALDTVTTLTEGDSSFAQFDLGTGELVVPELLIDGAVAGRNVRFSLTDAQQLLFTLVSFDP